MSLNEPKVKISKSHKDPFSRITIDDPPQEIADKLKMALTDSLPGITYDPSSRPGVSNLLEILSNFDRQGRTAQTLALECNSMSMREFKELVTSAVTEGLSSVRDKREGLVDKKNVDYLDSLADHGALQARTMAKKTMACVKQTIGLRLGSP